MSEAVVHAPARAGLAARLPMIGVLAAAGPISLTPPLPLETANFVRAKAESEGQARRRTESTAKTGGDIVL